MALVVLAASGFGASFGGDTPGPVAWGPVLGTVAGGTVEGFAPVAPTGLGPEPAEAAPVVAPVPAVGDFGSGGLPPVAPVTGAMGFPSAGLASPTLSGPLPGPVTTVPVGDFGAPPVGETAEAVAEDGAPGLDSPGFADAAPVAPTGVAAPPVAPPAGFDAVAPEAPGSRPGRTLRRSPPGFEAEAPDIEAAPVAPVAPGFGASAAFGGSPGFAVAGAVTPGFTPSDFHPVGLGRILGHIERLRRLGLARFSLARFGPARLRLGRLLGRVRDAGRLQVDDRPIRRVAAAPARTVARILLVLVGWGHGRRSSPVAPGRGAPEGGLIGSAWARPRGRIPPGPRND